jgi:hypothetical protein
MIDTIVLRVWNLQKHLALVEWLDRQHVEQGSQGKTIKMVRFTDGDEYTAQQKILHRTLINYHDSGEVHEVAHFNHLKSSHYLIAYKIDYNRNFIEFNMSVPKYMYGTNVIHFNTAPTGRNFSAYEHGTIEKNLREAHARLLRFVDFFFNEQFGGIGQEIDKREVEVFRIDLCYNQVFPSRQEAKDYLAQLRKLKKKGSREGTGYSRYKTGLVYKTRRYSIKCYHKGPEFKKNDAKELRKLNASGASYDVAHYQAFADTILRYEISYLYMNNLFRKDCHIWRHGLKLYKANKSEAQRPKTFMQYRAGLTADDKRHIDYVNNRISKTKMFYLDVAEDVLEHDAFTDEYEFNKVADKQQYFLYPALFSGRLMRLMGRRFVKLLKEFELNLKQDSTTILSALEKHNSEINATRKKLKAHDIETKNITGRKISISKIRAVLKLLETHTYEQIEEAGIFERRTWYNLRKDLESLGVTQQSLGGFTTSAAMDLHAYNAHVLHYSGYLGIKHLL